MNETIISDERTIAVENESYRNAYFVLAAGLLMDSIFRSGFLGQNCSDLLALIVVTGGFATYQQAKRRVLARQRWWWMVIAIMAVAAVTAAITAYFKVHRRF
jgi:hypothetical protein